MSEYEPNSAPAFGAQSGGMEHGAAERRARQALARAGKQNGRGGALSLTLGGLALSLGTLGLSTQAHAQLVEIEVRSFSLLPDGSLQVTFLDGRTAIIAPGDYTFVDGRLFIESTVLEEVGVELGQVISTGNGSGGFEIFGQNGWLVLGGAVAGGYLLADLLDEDSDGASGGGGSSTSSATGISAVDQLNTASISNAGNFAHDNAGEVVFADLSTLFTDNEGTVTYAITVTNSLGATVNDLVYLNGSQLLILNDPTADMNGAYQVRVTGTDTSNGNTAEAVIVVTVDVESEASIQGSIANVTQDDDDTAGSIVVSDVSVFFEDAEGSFTYTVSVTRSGQDFDNVLQFSGNSLVLSNAVTDTFVEFLNGVEGDEDITLTVTVTATDSVDGTELTQSFNLTLDATGVNDAPQLASGASSVVVVNEDSGGGLLEDGDNISLGLSSFVTDEEGDTLVWNITSDPTAGGLSISASGVVTGAIATADDNQEVTVTANDAANPTEFVTFTLYLDVA